MIPRLEQVHGKVVTFKSRGQRGGGLGVGGSMSFIWNTLFTGDRGEKAGLRRGVYKYQQ